MVLEGNISSTYPGSYVNTRFFHHIGKGIFRWNDLITENTFPLFFFPPYFLKGK